MAEGLRRRGVAAGVLGGDNQPLKSLKGFDILQKVDADFVEQSKSGGAVTLVTALVIAFLVYTEVLEFSRVEVVEHVEVDTGISNLIPFSINISFPSLRCADFNVDVLDKSGTNQHLAGELQKSLVAGDGLSAGGCRVHGGLEVKRLQGNIHFSPAAEDMAPHDLNTSHVIHDVSFGEELEGWASPLDGVAKRVSEGSAMHYRLHLVPTLHTALSGRDTSSYQYSVTQEEKKRPLVRSERGAQMASSSGPPGVFMQYDFGAFMMHRYEKRKPWSYLFTSICALVGGAFAIATMVDLVFSHLVRVQTVQC